MVQGAPRPADYDPANDRDAIAPFPARLRPGAEHVWDRGGNNLFSSAMHKTETIDYGILLAGERELILEDVTVIMKPGDVVIQVGAWHQWSNPKGSLMLFDMFAARFVDGPAGVAQGSSEPLGSALQLPEGVKPQRRIVTIDRENGKGALASDGSAPQVLLDPARPGFASARLWVTDSNPAKIVCESLQRPDALEPPPGGSTCRVLTLPPDEAWKGKVGSREVEAYFRAAGSPGASAHSPQAPHPYMQKTRTLEFCAVLEGEVVLVLDTQEVKLETGDIVIQRGTSHAWSNRSGRPARVAIATHDGSN